jgi:hypothetical protein
MRNVKLDGIQFVPIMFRRNAALRKVALQAGGVVLK